ncbi:hypothetical protein CHUAL_005348 [Chamberlinius hualienensis]
MKQVRQLEHRLLKCAQKNELDETKSILTSTRKKSMTGTLGRPSIKKSTDSLNLLDVEAPEKLSHIDINFKDETTGYTALMFAISNGNIDLVTMLVHFSADVNVQDNKGNTPLHLAVFNSSSKTVHILLSKEAKVNVANQDGNTPLHIACQHYGISDKYLIVKLLQVKPDVFGKNKDGATPLDLAAQYDKQEAVALLLDHEPTLRNSYRAFHEAAIRGHAGVLKLMLDYGIDPNIKDEKTLATALHETCRYLRYDSTKLLLTYGADANLADINDETPKSILSAYPSAKIDKFLQLFQEGSLSRQKPKYIESESDDEIGEVTLRRNTHLQLEEQKPETLENRSSKYTTALNWGVPPVEITQVEATIPDFYVEGDPEADEEVELLVEDALVSGNNVYRLIPQGPDKPSVAVFFNIAMVEEGTYTITVRSRVNPSVETSAVVTVEPLPPVDIDATFDALEQLLVFD